MNYLAHLYLSGDNQQILIGNFMADSIKGNQYLKYPKGIQNGILLHRFIDSFTDAHSLIIELKQLMYDDLHHYSGVAIDVLLDHILAKNWSNYSRIKLVDFVQSCYNILHDNYEILPDNVKQFLPIMIKHDWLYNYRTIEGITLILKQMNNRLKHEVDLSKSVYIMQKNIQLFESHFNSFIAELNREANQFQSNIN
ncbi:ACP phosphodiesterase [Psychroflexus sp. ALD_RP9]|uniref:acyl carrier protein phosphodiesterase n=1 Tax=Psychroflexus sp. ALD_RP9 TaxID=2777186 RepID=UPI001A8FD599|nr:acyl carrier protein phosphodiesterase [Psychroflexus sp. ALD_RP9]QSS97122.1 DUF479 domain-containing protein [Psychroflexus sp. ALD_RP9]